MRRRLRGGGRGGRSTERPYREGIVVILRGGRSTERPYREGIVVILRGGRSTERPYREGIVVSLRGGRDRSRPYGGIVTGRILSPVASRLLSDELFGDGGASAHDADGAGNGSVNADALEGVVFGGGVSVGIGGNV